MIYSIIMYYFMNYLQKKKDFIMIIIMFRTINLNSNVITRPLSPVVTCYVT